MEINKPLRRVTITLYRKLSQTSITLSRKSMNNKISLIINVILLAATSALAFNFYQMKQELVDSTKSAKGLHESIEAIKAHQIELAEKDSAMSTLLSDLIIKSQEHDQNIEELLSKQSKKK